MPAALAIPLLLLLAVFVSYASAALQHSQNTGLVGWLTGKLASLPIIGGLSVKQILKLDQWMTNMLGRHFKQIEHAGVRWLSALDSFTRRNAKAALNVAAPVWALAYWLVHTEIGRQAKARDKPIARTASHALAVATDARDRAIGHKTTPVVVKQGKTITRVEHVTMPHAAEWDWLTHHWGGLKKAISLASVGALAPTLPRVHVPSVPWGLTPTRLRRMLRGLGVPIGLGALAVSMAAVLRVSPRCLTHGNVGKVSRKLCGAPPKLLDDFLALLADVWILDNVCVLIPLLEEGASKIAVPLVEGLTIVGAGLCKGSIGAPDSLKGVAPIPPPFSLTVAPVEA